MGAVGARVGGTPGLSTASRCAPPTAPARRRPTERTPPAPNGASGYHSIRVEVQLSADERAPGVVLVVDDEPMVREVIASYLERDGWKVAAAADGATALRILESTRPDLVVLDLMLPEVDGLSVLARLRTTTDVPVIVVTARGEEARPCARPRPRRRRLPGEAVLAARARRPSAFGGARSRPSADAGRRRVASSTAASSSMGRPARSSSTAKS